MAKAGRQRGRNGGFRLNPSRKSEKQNPAFAELEAGGVCEAEYEAE